MAALLTAIDDLVALRPEADNFLAEITAVSTRGASPLASVQVDKPS